MVVIKSHGLIGFQNVPARTTLHPLTWVTNRASNSRSFVPALFLRAGAVCVSHYAVKSNGPITAGNRLTTTSRACQFYSALFNPDLNESLCCVTVSPPLPLRLPARFRLKPDPRGAARRSSEEFKVCRFVVSRSPRCVAHTAAFLLSLQLRAFRSYSRSPWQATNQNLRNSSAKFLTFFLFSNQNKTTSEERRALHKTPASFLYIENACFKFGASIRFQNRSGNT